METDSVFPETSQKLGEYDGFAIFYPISDKTTLQDCRLWLSRRDELKKVANLVYKRPNHSNFVLAGIFVGFGEFGWFDVILLLSDCTTFPEYLKWIIKTCSYQKLG